MTDETDKIKNVMSIAKVIQTFGGWIVSLVIGVISVLLWLQSNGDTKYYPKISGENLEKYVQKQSDKLDQIENQNNAIMGTLGELKGIVMDREFHR